ncbi:MAG TPA: hypothetical protein VEQ63_05885, partial [Bryobacteraceae bacterium]|nr:hypothetical protein [Bryobacteraceae bacterium]
MSDQSEPKLDINSWLEDELYQSYLHDRKHIDESWRSVFETNGHGEARPSPTNGSKPAAQPSPVATAPAVPTAVPAGDNVPMRGVAGKIAENMTASLTIPTATSQRIVQVRVLEENRLLLNQ